MCRYPVAEPALTSIRLDPHDDVQRFAVSQSAGLHDFSHVPPVAAHEVNGAISRDPGGVAQCVSQELDISHTDQRGPDASREMLPFFMGGPAQPATS
jgi:hypothetical protein